MEHTSASRAARAEELFIQGYSCAQAVLGAFCDVTGLDFDTSMRLASSFGAGMGRMREVCGACSAMFMVAGLVFGPTDTDPQKKGDQYARIQEMAESFRKENGTLICRDLLAALKTDTRPTPEERNASYYKVRPCLRFVRDAAEITDEYLRAHGALSDSV